MISDEDAIRQMEPDELLKYAIRITRVARIQEAELRKRGIDITPELLAAVVEREGFR